MDKLRSAAPHRFGASIGVLLERNGMPMEFTERLILGYLRGAGPAVKRD